MNLYSKNRELEREVIFVDFSISETERKTSKIAGPETENTELCS